jgi:hypothetical protein
MKGRGQGQPGDTVREPAMIYTMDPRAFVPVSPAIPVVMSIVKSTPAR